MDIRQAEKYTVYTDLTMDTPHYWENYWSKKDGLGSSDYDPDTCSKALQTLNQKIWNKTLPNGEKFDLQISSTDYLVWDGMRFGSDSIIVSFQWHKCIDLIQQLYATMKDYRGFIEDFLHRTYTFGGELIFPKHRNSMNQARGTNPLICDRFDITLECIRRYYLGEENPLSSVFEVDKKFFDAFIDFKGYVDFFFLNDLVTDDYNAVKFWDDWKDFGDNLIPRTVDEYIDFLDKEVKFVKARNARIAAAIVGDIEYEEAMAPRVCPDMPSYDVTIPEGETVVDNEKLEKFLKKHLNKEMSIRYQSAKDGSGAKWRTLKLVEYDYAHFRCTSPGNADRVFTYRRDRVLEISDELRL